MTSTIMLETIEEFKKNKLVNYYKNLSRMTQIHLENNNLYSDFWSTVSLDANLQKYSGKNDDDY